MKVAVMAENNFHWVENLRVIAIFSIILLHFSGPILYLYGHVPEHIWITGNIIDSCTRFAVPVFVMISGALLLPKNEEIGYYLSRRLKRILLPFLFWSVIYIALVIYKKSRLKPLSAADLADNVFNLLKNGSAEHLWYVYMLIGLYLVIPVLRRWIQHCPQKEIRFFLICWFITIAVEQPLLTGLKTAVSLSSFAGFMGYLVLGYYLSVNPAFSSQKAKTLSWLMIVSGIVITISGTHYLTYTDGRFNGYFYGYLKPNTLLVASGVFVMAKNMLHCGTTLMVRFISRYSFGIYLAHILIMRALDKLHINYNLLHPAVGIPLAAGLCLTLTAAVVFVVNKAPYGKYISG
ncbi:MAG: hypothetical protein CFE23_00030 [Flavobacterium sp. BFFFF1]|uniref:acyltransferase n=1 Tax=Flavobacterium sp. BFFFF1 TaxID=2015557 RepID=UPI000BD06DA0|nr:acyltransferase family protein [Flavobacterium sp. BFFFF1]OYU82150.1 MAG: hypothetical protein CFE23_00030 [Flavobacterium sp. BFFFF1]